ncbi:hypothetical protein DBY63_010140 [Pseudomonas sp. RIT411]|nr:hypothetical protein DBY63_010140 [Pseudomonas sp. RIT 411]
MVPCRVKALALPAWAAKGLCKEDGLEVRVRALLPEHRQQTSYERSWWRQEPAAIDCRSSLSSLLVQSRLTTV